MPPTTSPHPTQDDGDLEIAARQLHRRLSELLRLLQLRDRDRICCHDISVSQCYALEAIVEAGPLRLNDLAGRLLLDKSTASRVVDGLIAKGYAMRSRDAADGRAVNLEATDRGRALRSSIEAEMIAEARCLITGLKPEVRPDLDQLLGRLLQVVRSRVEVGAGCCHWQARR